jgi:hypothetical protein
MKWREGDVEGNLRMETGVRVEDGGRRGGESVTV